MHDRRKLWRQCKWCGDGIQTAWYGKYHKNQNPVLQEGTEKEAEDFHKLPEYTFRDELLLLLAFFDFTRAMPKNLLEISQIVSNLWGKVSRKTLLSQVPFVDDVESELEAVEEEEQEAVKRQQEMFGNQPNTPFSPEDDTDGQKDVENGNDKE